MSSPDTSFNLHIAAIMDTIDAIKEEIRRTETILVESRDNYRKNPDQYSAKLLLLSTENYLADLLRKLDALTSTK